MIKDTSSQDRFIDQPRSYRIPILGAVIVVMILSAIFAWPAWQRWASAEQSVSLKRLRLATVTRGELVRDISAQGTVVAAVKPTLFSPATGVVTLYVNAGESVQKDKLIAEVDSPEILNLLDQERSTLASAESNYRRQEIQARKIQLENQQRVDLAEVALTAARRELRRAEAAHARQAISEFDYDKARDDVATAELKHRHASEDAKLQLDSLAFELDTAKLDIDRERLKVADLERQVKGLRVLSPVTGMVGNLSVDNKDAVVRNQPLVTVVDLSAFAIELQVPDSWASNLIIGLDAEISHQSNRYPGRLVAISPEVINSQITAQVRFAGEVPKNLRQNQRVSARILLEGKSDALMVERGPFLESSGGRYTYVVEGNLARKQPIATGIISVGNVEILSGLQEGQTVIVSSLTEFSDADVLYLSD